MDETRIIELKTEQGCLDPGIGLINNRINTEFG